mgnify:CR=1 FL=1
MRKVKKHQCLLENEEKFFDYLSNLIVAESIIEEHLDSHKHKLTV